MEEKEFVRMLSTFDLFEKGNALFHMLGKVGDNDEESKPVGIELLVVSLERLERLQRL